MKNIYTKEYALFLKTILNLRKKKKMTQKQVAERLSKPQSYVSKYENGERRIDLIEFLAIAKALDESAVSILKELDIE